MKNIHDNEQEINADETEGVKKYNAQIAGEFASVIGKRLYPANLTEFIAGTLEAGLNRNNIWFGDADCPGDGFADQRQPNDSGSRREAFRG